MLQWPKRPFCLHCGNTVFAVNMVKRVDGWMHNHCAAAVDEAAVKEETAMKDEAAVKYEAAVKDEAALKYEATVKKTKQQ